MSKHVMPKHTPAWDKPDPTKRPHHMTGVEKNRAKQWARNHNVPYPSFVANTHGKKKK